MTIHDREEQVEAITKNDADLAANKRNRTFLIWVDVLKVETVQK